MKRKQGQTSRHDKLRKLDIEIVEVAIFTNLCLAKAIKKNKNISYEKEDSENI